MPGLATPKPLHGPSTARLSTLTAALRSRPMLRLHRGHSCLRCARSFGTSAQQAEHSIEVFLASTIANGPPDLTALIRYSVCSGISRLFVPSYSNPERRGEAAGTTARPSRHRIVTAEAGSPDGLMACLQAVTGGGHGSTAGYCDLLTCHHYGGKEAAWKSGSQPTISPPSRRRSGRSNRYPSPRRRCAMPPRYGFDRSSIVRVIQLVERRMFYKSMATFTDHRIWQDVYHVPVEDGSMLYVKLQANVVTEFSVVSFKEK